MTHEDLAEQHRLVTARLVLRRMVPSDVPNLFGIFSDPEVTRYWSSPPLREIGAAERMLAEIDEGWRTGRLLQWGIARRHDDLLIGTCTLSDVSVVHRRASLGYALGRAWWHQGYASEALPAVVRFAFERLRLHRLEADVDPRNIASIRQLERLGFQREGYLRERYHHVDEIQDAVLFGLLRSDWSEPASLEGVAPDHG